MTVSYNVGWQMPPKINFKKRLPALSWSLWVALAEVTEWRSEVALVKLVFKHKITIVAIIFVNTYCRCIGEMFYSPLKNELHTFPLENRNLLCFISYVCQVYRIFITHTQLSLASPLHIYYYISLFFIPDNMLILNQCFRYCLHIN